MLAAWPLADLCGAAGAASTERERAVRWSVIKPAPEMGPQRLL